MGWASQEDGTHLETGRIKRIRKPIPGFSFIAPDGRYQSDTSSIIIAPVINGIRNVSGPAAASEIAWWGWISQKSPKNKKNPSKISQKSPRNLPRPSEDLH